MAGALTTAEALTTAGALATAGALTLWAPPASGVSFPFGVLPPKAHVRTPSRAIPTSKATNGIRRAHCRPRLAGRPDPPGGQKTVVSGRVLALSRDVYAVVVRSSSPAASGGAPRLPAEGPAQGRPR